MNNNCQYDFILIFIPFFMRNIQIFPRNFLLSLYVSTDVNISSILIGGPQDLVSDAFWRFLQLMKYMYLYRKIIYLCIRSIRCKILNSEQTLQCSLCEKIKNYLHVIIMNDNTMLVLILVEKIRRILHQKINHTVLS